MGLIMNATNEVQKFTVFGNHFEMKPAQIKMFTDNMSFFIAIERRDLGLVSLPPEFEDQDYRTSPEGVAKLAELKAEGVKNRVKKLKEIIYNNQVSLRQDLERANLKAAPEAFASQGEIRAMEELAKYAETQEVEEIQRVDKINKLKEKIAKVR